MGGVPHAEGYPSPGWVLPGDNAAIESFFGLLEENVLDRRTWATREELRIAIVTWIERI